MQHEGESFAEMWGEISFIEILYSQDLKALSYLQHTD